MAVDFSNFSAPILESPLKNGVEDFFKGYTMSQIPSQLKDAKEQRALANRLKTLEVEHKPKEYALKDEQMNLINSLKSKANSHYEEKYGQERDLRKAMIEKALRKPELKFSGNVQNEESIWKLAHPEGAKTPEEQAEHVKLLTDAMKVPTKNNQILIDKAIQFRNNLSPQDPNYQKDYKTAQNYIDKLSQVPGAQPAIGPGEGIKINLPEGKEGYIAGLGALKQGWQSVTDADGKVIGVNVPMSDDQIKQWKGKEKFDVVFPFVNKSLSQYTGQDSWEHFSDDVTKYNVDQAAKERIDNFYAAKKLLSIETTSENARIGGHATNVQLQELKKSLDSSEVFKRLESGGGFVLPSKYAQASGDIFKSYLDKVEQAAKTNIPAYEFRSLNPGNNISTNVVPKTPTTVKTKEQFQSWLKTLTPAQRAAHKAQHLGGK